MSTALPSCITASISYNNATLTGSTTIQKGYLELNGTCVVTGNICIEKGGSLKIPAGSSATINGNMCIERGSEVLIGGSAWDYETTDIEAGVPFSLAGGSITITGDVTITDDCHCGGCD